MRAPQKQKREDKQSKQGSQHMMQVTGSQVTTGSRHDRHAAQGACARSLAAQHQTRAQELQHNAQYRDISQEQ